MVFGPEKVELDLQFVQHKLNQDDFVLVNRAASRLPRDEARNLKYNLHGVDGDHRSVLVLLDPFRHAGGASQPLGEPIEFGACWGCLSGRAFAFWTVRLA